MVSRSLARRLIPRSDIKTKYETNIFSATASQQIFDKNFENKRNCHEKLHKNLSYGVKFKL